MEERINSEKYLIDKADQAISELVYDKVHLIKAYNYYAGIRDRSQFAHLEQNYGIGNPTNITFTPLIRKHIDALVGEYLTLPLDPGISCKDEKTLNNIFREKQLKISQELVKVIKPKLQNLIYSLIRGDGKNKINDVQFEAELKNVEDFVENNFISDYEIAAQNIIENFIQSRTVDLKNKLQQLILDLFIAGEVYYLVEPTVNNTGVNLKILNPMNCFPDVNVNSQYINDSYRFVYREYLSKQELLAQYGEDLTREDLKHIEKDDVLNTTNSSHIMMLSSANGRFGMSDCMEDGIIQGMAAVPTYAYRPSIPTSLFCVYHVQWVDVEKQKDGTYKQNRFHVTKIGGDIYILKGRDDNAVRSVTSPEKVKLSVNGLRYKSRTGRPYSLMLATADLQDLYDYYQFMKSTLIAQSGTAGDWIDIAYIPNWLGTQPQEKLQKWLAYKKSGVAMLDSSQEGLPMSNATFQGYDDTVKLQAIQAVDVAIQDIENTAMQITGVYRERLGGLQPRDAVANVETGLQQSFIVTKQYFRAMDHIEKEILLDMLNVAKIVYKDGISGTLILGNQRKIFTALPEHYTLTDFDIHIRDSQEAIKERTQVQQMALELIKGGLTDPELLLTISSSKSITDMKTTVSKQIKAKREENNQLQQLQQQLQEAQQQMQQMQQQMQKQQQELEKYNAEEMQLKKLQLDKEYEVALAKIKSNERISKEKLEYDKKRVDLEALQLFDNNPYNDKIKDK